MYWVDCHLATPNVQPQTSWATGSPGTCGGDDCEGNEVGQEMIKILRDVERLFGEAITIIDWDSLNHCFFIAS